MILNLFSQIKSNYNIKNSGKYAYSALRNSLKSNINKTFQTSNRKSFHNPYNTAIKSILNPLSKKNFTANRNELETNTISEPIQEIDISSKASQDDEHLQVMKSKDPKKIRNVAIIAHVDHGKTTLVDCMLKRAGINIEGSERAMDSNELEQERGITILSKCTGISYNGFKINIVDTPGHQDFGGEVERIMDMVESVCLVVCATEGPMPQTRYVLSKALSRGLKPIVVINKVDRDSARLVEVENEIFDLFISLNANDEQMEYPLIYASAKEGWAVKDLSGSKENVTPLLDQIIEYCPYPKANIDDSFTMLVSQIESNNFFGKMLIGRIHSGQVNSGDLVVALDQQGNLIEKAKIFKLIRRFGTNQIELDSAAAGDIILLSGFKDATVSHTINSPSTSKIIKVTLSFKLGSTNRPSNDFNRNLRE